MTEVSDRIEDVRAQEMIDSRYARMSERWTWQHDLEHTDEEWEALILRYALNHQWLDVAVLARRAVVMGIARPLAAIESPDA